MFALWGFKKISKSCIHLARYTLFPDIPFRVSDSLSIIRFEWKRENHVRCIGLLINTAILCFILELSMCGPALITILFAAFID